jgi:glyoxylase-like metal-dependent hydrolase (beta-lactamase superfamily II)
MHRRQFITSLIGGVAGAVSARRVFADSRPPMLESTTITDDAFLVTGAAANIVVLRQDDGLLVVNGGSADEASVISDFLHRRFGAMPVLVLFNTDWHAHNVGLNERVGTTGATIVAHENTKLWLGTDVSVKWEGRTYKRLPPAARPNTTFYTDHRMTFGRHRVASAYLGQAHTDGDIYVFLPDANVLIVGDVVSAGSYPVLDYSTGGWIGGLAAATKTLLGVGDASTRIVPANGPVQSRAYVQAQSDMLNAVRDRVVKMLKQGMGADEMIAAAPTREFDAIWGDPERFMESIYPGLWYHARELGGVI